MSDESTPTALRDAVSAGEYAAGFGFDWDEAIDALDKVREETAELQVAIEQSDGVDEELGDLLFAVCNVARKLQIDPEASLEAGVEKFKHRFRVVLDTVNASGRDPRELSLDELEEIWIASK